MLFGIDVSNHQGMINWEAVANDGVKFAFIKASQGISFKDTYFPRNWQAAKEHGIIRGAYHFPEPYNNTDARTEADWFYEQLYEVGGLELGDMLVLDAELMAHAPDGQYGDWCLYWAQIIQSYFSVAPLIYTNQYYIGKMGLHNPELGNYGLWNANWRVQHAQITQTLKQGGNVPLPSTPSPWSITAFWQYTDSGRVSGISGNADLNAFNGDESQISLYGLKQKEEPQPEPTPIDVAAIEAQLNTIEISIECTKGHLLTMESSVNEIRNLLEGSNSPT